MNKLTIFGMAVAVLAGAPALAQQAPQNADAANAQSMPQQGSEAALATPVAEPRAYPLCSRTVTDSCINPRETGHNHGNRPLRYWTGRPASELR